MIEKKEKPTGLAPKVRDVYRKHGIVGNPLARQPVGTNETLVAPSDTSTRLGSAPAKNQHTEPAGVPQTRKRRRTADEKGLPEDGALRNLARTYLETQARVWPELIRDGYLPKPTTQAIDQLAADLKRRFLTKEVAVFRCDNSRAKPWTALGCSYDRYSCENSNPRSLDQQLRLQLERARSDHTFIPPGHLYFDAAVTGTTAFRRGYEMAKQAIETDAAVTVMYVDELGRASRDMVETLLLGKLVQRLGKRLIGLSDGFDTDSPMWKVTLSIFGALQEWFIDQLRSKVRCLPRTWS